MKPSSPLKRIGLFGGTFDPIHFGHLRAAWEIRQKVQLDEIRFIPSYLPPHRAPTLATTEARVDMVKLAINDTPEFVLDTHEVDRKGASYMFDTVCALKQELNPHELYLILGMDAYAKIATWHRAEELVSLIQIIVMHRPKHPLPDENMANSLIKKGKATIIDITALDISATMIRKQIHDYQLPRFLVPEAVLKYMVEHKLYQSPEETS